MRARLPAFILFLAACQPVTVTTPAPDACGASGYQGLIGTPLAAITLPADLNARVIGPETMVTTDFSPSRMNIMLDAAGVVTEVTCG